MFCMGQKIKIKRAYVSLLGVLVCLLKDELFGLIDGLNVVPRPPGHIGSLVL